MFGVFANREPKGSCNESSSKGGDSTFQPSNIHVDSKNKRSCGIPKENETMFTNSLQPYESLDQKESHISTLSLQVEHKVEENAITDVPRGNNETVTQSYDNNSNFLYSHFSL